MPPGDQVAVRRGPSRKAPIVLVVLAAALLVARVVVGIVDPPPAATPFEGQSGSVQLGH